MTNFTGCEVFAIDFGNSVELMPMFWAINVLAYMVIASNDSPNLCNACLISVLF